MKITYVEQTPNPNALKFHLDGRLLDQGNRSFDTPEAAQGDPLASALFGAGRVTSVFMMPTFITISKTPDEDWFDMKPAITRIMDEVTPVEPVETPAAAPQEASPALSNDERLQRINQILDTMIRPALAGDGGGLEVLSLLGNELRIRYQGACGTCPSSIAGTLGAIQNMLRVEVDSDLMVIPG